MEKKKVTRVGYALDRSGSMKSILNVALEALNQNVAELKKSTEEVGQDATLSLVTFDDNVNSRFFNRSISSFEPFKPNDITAGNMTALFDATIELIEKMRRAPVGSDEDVTYLVTIITDGEENASSKGAEKKLKVLMNLVQATDRWTLTFLVPVGSKRTLVHGFGIPEGNVMEWEASAEGVKRYAAANSAGLRNYVTAREQGQTSTKSYYTDLSNVSIKDVKQNLVDVSKDINVLNVDKDNDIRSFIESKGRTFEKGLAFYQLIPLKKTADKVQAYKLILVRDKVSGRVFGGADARAVLNLPLNETKVRPGDHGNFDIFIQSTSVNRKVTKGTKVVLATKELVASLL